MLSKSDEMLFALLKGSLYKSEPENELFKGLSPDNWQQCYESAARQGVLALAWDGLELLPKEQHPQKSLKLQWGMSVEKYEAKHKWYCKTAEQLQKFYANNGIVAVQMKGVGLSASYNRPAHREGGDIDIHTYSADERTMTHREANLLADELVQKLGIEVDTSKSEKHSNFYYKGIPIENHQWFVNMELNPKFLTKLNSILKEILMPHKVQLLGGECELLVPSQQFNTVFLAYHAFQHLGSGIALHHLYDWANLIKNNGLHLPNSITEKTFLRGVAALTLLCNRYLGTNVNLAGYPHGYEELAEQMLQEMLAPKFASKVPYSNPFMIVWYKLKRVLYSNTLRAKTLEASRLYMLYRSVYWHLKYPSTILTRGDK